LIGKNFKLIAEGSYLDAHYVSFPDAASTYLGKQDGQETQNLSGAPLDFAPRWSGTLTAEYATTIFDDYRLTADLTPIFNSSYFNSNGTDDPQLLIKSSMRWDGQLTLAQLSKHWAIDIIGKNLTNRVIVVEPDQNEIPGAKQEPRNVALQFRYKW
jgi:hypothetical protein